MTVGRSVARPMRRFLRDLDAAYLANKRKARLRPEARYASVVIEPGRIEIALYDADPDWLVRAQAALDGQPPKFVIYHPEVS